METAIILLGILVIAFILSLRSMKDFAIPKEVRRILETRKIKGTIVFLRGRITHYHR